MAPHWKCGSGQPVAGSNPALSANARRSDGPWRRWRLRSSLTHLQVRSLRCSAPPCHGPPSRRASCRCVDRLTSSRSSLASFGSLLTSRTPVRRASSLRTRSAIAAACCCSTPLSGSATTSSTPYYRIKARHVPDVLAEAGHRDGGRHIRRELPPPRRPRRPEQPRSRASRSTSSRPSGRSPTRRSTRSSTGSISRAPTTDRSRATTSSSPGSGSSRRQATRLGHQSLVVTTARATSSSPARRCYTAGEWAGDPDAREGRSRAPDQAAYDRSVERLKRDLDARSRVDAFGHDRARRLDGPEPEGRRRRRRGRRAGGYPSEAVLGGELAVPCTCNPL